MGLESEDFTVILVDVKPKIMNRINPRMMDGKNIVTGNTTFIVEHPLKFQN